LNWFELLLYTSRGEIFTLVGVVGRAGEQNPCIGVGVR